MLGGVFLSALEGFQRAYIKNYLLSAASFSNLILAILLIPKFELKGLFYSYLISNSLVYILAWGFVRNQLNGRIFIFPLSWNQELFRQTFNYNATFQLISVSSLFNDPLLRMLLVRFGGLPLAGIYELASKLILQVRAILVALNQNLVPVFAGMEGKEDGQNRISLFMKSFHLNFALSNLVLALLAAALPAISIIWLETGQMVFIQLSLMLIPGWIINTMSVPVYFANIGFGQLKPVLYHHLSLGFLVPSLCYLAGVMGLPLGVVFSWSLGLAVCSLPLITEFFSRHRIAFSYILPPGFRWMLLAHVVFIAAWIWVWLSEFSFSLLSGLIFASGGIILYTFAYAKAGFFAELKMLLKK
jgi:O-antigen/teichoic acid export membrane protein